MVETTGRTLTHFQCNLFFRYHLQDNNETQDLILHGEPNHSLRGYHVSDGFSVLSAFGLWGESDALRLDIALPHCIFLAIG